MIAIMPEVLIVSNRFDFACDYISALLFEQGVTYLRLNTDDLSDLEICMYPAQKEIIVWIDHVKYVLNDANLKSIYFRAPTFLRETSIYDLSPEEKLSKTQWASFTRALMMFDSCKWLNHPMHTYYAENKPVQLVVASEIGFSVPDTLLTNSSREITQFVPNQSRIVLKGADTVFIGLGDETHAFTYTNIVSKEVLAEAELSSAPVLLQEFLEPKVDLRVTVIGSEVFSVEILENDKGITGDWRLRKDQVVYVSVNLPDDIQEKCVTLVKKLGLSYGAIDLARVVDKYYFIEINPTGEWAWLVDRAGLPIDREIATFLLKRGE